MIKRTHLNSINVAPYDNDDSSPETTRLIDDSPVGSDTSLKKLEDVGTNSVPWTYVLIFKGYVGAGILGMGFAAQNGKFLPSNIGLAAITALALYCVMLLCRVHDHVGQSVTSLEDIAFVVASSFSQKFGRISRLTVKTIISYTQIGFSTAYIIFIAQNMCLMTDIAWRWFVLILFIPCLLSCFITKLKVLAPFAFFGSICILVGLAVVLWFCLVEKRSQFEESLNKETLLAFDYTTLPIWFGIVVYAFEGIGLVVPMRKAMQQPDKFLKTMSISYVLLAILFGTFSSITMLTFREETKQIVLSNLPTMGRLDWLASSVRIAVSVALFFTFNLQLFPVIEIFENALLSPATPGLVWKRRGVRTALVVVCCALASFVPHFGLFISLIGNLGASLLMFILPAMLHLACFWSSAHPTRKAFHFLIILFGVVATAIGTARTVDELIHAASDHALCSG